MEKKLLENVSGNPELLKKLAIPQLEELCRQIRDEIVNVVSRTGGHLASNLGVVEITAALHFLLNIPPDKIIFDVGHQVYPHKLLTGRFGKFSTLRQNEGISGFPNPEESETDLFFSGHAGTAVSAALGLKTGEEKSGIKNRIAVVIGDGSLTNGLTFEGLNNLGYLKKNLLIILNDNKFSISPTKGAMSYYLTRFATSPVLSRSREELEEILSRIPHLGNQILKMGKDFEKKTKDLIVPGIFFEKLGIRYFGPINGHDIRQMLEVLKNIMELEGPILLHVVTQKGRGYKPAEEQPERFHSTRAFTPETGKPLNGEQSTGRWLTEKLVENAVSKEFYVITSAMDKGLGFSEFSRKFPDRFFDVGIAESHSMVFASGLAKSGKKVFVGVYSTFLQRTYDQIFHDLCLQNSSVVILIDRAGIVEGDGPTHQGIYDISFLRALPLIKIFAPYSLKNFENVLQLSFEEKGPVAIRYPKTLPPDNIPDFAEKGNKVLLLGTGSAAGNLFSAYERLADRNFPVSFMPVSRIKPIEDRLVKALENFETIVTCEENITANGFGTSILEYCCENRIERKFLRIGLPETFLETGSRDFLLKKYGLDTESIVLKIEEFLKNV